MSRTEFLEKLKNLLNDIPDGEREEALNFYNDYFDEAGSENEDNVIMDLESPEKVAEIIKAGLNDKVDESGEYSERGYQDRRFVNSQEISKRTETVNNTRKSANRQTERKTDVGKIILIIILCFIAAPVGVPMIIAIVSIIFAFFVSIIGIAFGLFMAAIGIFIAGIALVFVSFTKMLIAPFAAFCLLGAGLLLTGLSIIGMMLLIMIAAQVIPALCRGIVSLFQKPFRKRGVEA